MKSAVNTKWLWRILFTLIFSLIIYGYITERAHRIKIEEAARELIIAYDAELGDYRVLVNSMASKQIQQDLQIHGLTNGVIQQRRTIYELYHQLRKYNKQLPPWGGEYKPMDPEDKWTKNDI